MKRLLWFSTLSLLLLAPFAAMAYDGYVTGTVNMRAGPDSDYPRITRLHAGERIAIHGCIDHYRWCDVEAYDDRGWVAGRFVQYEYEGRRVYLHDYGRQIGIPIVAFALGAYWGDHYSSHPWYGHRDSWERSSHGPRPHYSYSNYYSTRSRTDSYRYQNQQQAPSRTERQGTSAGYAPSRQVQSQPARSAEVVTQPTQRRATTTTTTRYPTTRSVEQPTSREAYQDRQGQSRPQEREVTQQPATQRAERTAQPSGRDAAQSNGTAAREQRQERQRDQQPRDSRTEHTQVARQSEPAQQSQQQQHKERPQKQDKGDKGDKREKEDKDEKDEKDGR
jgi:uncharacterized protein YraI